MSLDDESGFRATQFKYRFSFRLTLHGQSSLTLTGRCVYALRDATGALRSTGKRRLCPLHRAVLHHNRALQRKRSDDGGNRG